MTRTLVTLKFDVAAGSAVAVKPVRTQAWLPRDTVTPTGRFVLRNRMTASRRALSNVFDAINRYRPSMKWRIPAAQPCASTPADNGRE